MVTASFLSLFLKLSRFGLTTIKNSKMNKIIRDQFKIISWKNWLIIKRNPVELVVDIMWFLLYCVTSRYPIIFLCILVGVSSGVKNQFYEVLFLTHIYSRNS